MKSVKSYDRPLIFWAFENDPAVKHVGPMAQDFYNAFSVGMDDRHIATVDADGVALAAIQGLNQKVEDRSKEIEAKSQKLENENAELKRELAEIKQMLNKLSDNKN